MVIFGGGLLLAVIIGAVVALGQKKPVVVPNGAYLVFDLTANIQDTPAQTDGLGEIVESLGGRSRSVLQLRAITRALQAAAKMKRSRGSILPDLFNRPVMGRVMRRWRRSARLSRNLRRRANR